MSDSGVNPYDFRHPVADAVLLVGRDGQLQTVDSALREAAHGRPVHLSLIGTSGSGKSSLLGGVRRGAQARGLLPVPIVLTASAVESELSFAVTLVDALLSELRNEHVLDPDSPMLAAWLQHTLLADSAGTEPSRALEVGLLAAAAAAGRTLRRPILQPLIRDLETLLATVEESGLRGIVFTIDEAHHLDANRDLPPALKSLAESTRRVTLVTASESPTALESAAARSLETIEVGPFLTLGDIYEAIVAPLHTYDNDQIDVSWDTIRDIALMTGGQPYEVNLMCHHIWEALQQGEQDAFELSPTVLNGVFCELETKGRHQASTDIARLDGLSSDSWERLENLAPHEALTTRQIALSQLLPAAFSEKQLEERMNAVAGDLQSLARAGVITTEQDRFLLVGDAATRMYLKYALRRRAGKSLDFQQSFSRRATLTFMKELAAADVVPGTRSFAWGRPQELGDSRAGTWVNELLDAVDSGNISEIAATANYAYGTDVATEYAGQGLVVIGFELRIGLEEIDHAEFFHASPCDVHGDLEASISTWLEEQRALFALYDVSVRSVRVGCLTPETTQAFAAYSQLATRNGLIVGLYRAGSFDAAAAILEEAIDAVESLVTDDPRDPLVRAKLCDAYNRLGFIRATQGDLIGSDQLLSKALSLSQTEAWIALANRGYVAAADGRLEDAAALIEASIAECPEDGFYLLLGFFPTGAGWTPPTPLWNEVDLRGGWIRKFLTLQRDVVLAQVAGPDGHSDLRAAIDGVDPAAPVGIQRLRAWSLLTLLGDPERATKCFEDAFRACPRDRVEHVRDELAFASGVK